MAAKDGDLRVWWIRNVPNKAIYKTVTDIGRAKKYLHLMAEADLRNKYVTSNAGGLEVFRDGEWEEWENEDGDDIDAIMDKE